MLIEVGKSAGNCAEDLFPYGVCDRCGYELNSELLFEYDFQHCPGCGSILYPEGHENSTPEKANAEYRKKNLSLLNKWYELSAAEKQIADTLEQITPEQKCDRCGAAMDSWQKESEKGTEAYGGNCTLCGDDLCSECAGDWTEDGICRNCEEKAIDMYAKAQSQFPLGGAKTYDDLVARLTGNTGLPKRFDEYLDTEKKKSKSEMVKGKLRWDLLPWEQLEEVMRVLDYGAKKYAPDDWKQTEPFTETYSAALMRHLAEWNKGKHFDSEASDNVTIMYHMAQVACNALYLLWFDMNSNTDEVLIQEDQK